LDITIFKQAINLTLIGVSVAFGLLLFLMFLAYLTSFFSKKLLKVINDKNSILTLLHLKIHANAFRKSLCYFQAEPLSVNLYGVREWRSLYPLIETFKLSETLDYYRSKGLNFFKYIYCKNYTLRDFASNLTKIIIGGKTTGLHSLNFNKHIFQNLLYPNVYLSIFYFIFRKIIILNGKIKKQNEN